MYETTTDVRLYPVESTLSESGRSWNASGITPFSQYLLRQISLLIGKVTRSTEMWAEEVREVLL